MTPFADALAVYDHGDHVVIVLDTGMAMGRFAVRTADARTELLVGTPVYFDDLDCALNYARHHA